MPPTIPLNAKHVAWSLVGHQQEGVVMKASPKARWFAALGVTAVAAGLIAAPSSAGATAIATAETKVAASGHGVATLKGTVNFSAVSTKLSNIVSGAHAAKLIPGFATPAGQSGKLAGPTPLVSTPTLVKKQWAGTSNATSSCGCQPPDTNAAIGGSYVVEAVNLALATYNKSGVLSRRISINSFLGTSEPLSDPRILYDNVWKRWVLTVIPIPANASSTPALWMAASTTANPNGTWFVYRFGFSGGPYPLGALLDYPMVGMDSDSVVVSTNNFNSANAFIGGAAFAVAKQRLYNGQGIGFSAFNVSPSTHPSIAFGQPQAQYGKTYLVAANGGGGFDLYYMTNSSKPDSTTMVFQGSTSNGLWASPGPGRQPAGFPNLDALDGRLQAPPYQVGGLIWFAHSSGFPVIQYGFLNTGTAGVGGVAATLSVAYQAGSSYDWNPSIAVGNSGHVFLNWVYADPTVGTPVSLRVSGLAPGDPVQSLAGVGTTVFTGSLGNNSRFGDYSSVSVDQASTASCPAGANALVINETFAANQDWNTRIARVGFC